MATLLVASMAARYGRSNAGRFRCCGKRGTRRVGQLDPAPLVQSLLARCQAMTAGVDATALLAKSSADATTTLDRALTLLWLRKAFGGDVAAASSCRRCKARAGRALRTATGTPLC